MAKGTGLKGASALFRQTGVASAQVGVTPQDESDVVDEQAESEKLKHEKKNATLYLRSDTVEMIEDAVYQAKKRCPKLKSSINKSTLIDAALRLALDELVQQFAKGEMPALLVLIEESSEN